MSIAEIQLAVDSFTQFITGIVSAELNAGRWRRASENLNEQITEFTSQLQSGQAQVETQVLSDYEKQLKKESNIQQLKAAGLVVLMLLVVIALLYFFKKSK